MPKVEAEVVETVIEGKVPVLGTMLPDVEAWTGWPVGGTATTAGIMMLDTTLESIGDSHTGGSGRPLEVTTFVLVTTPAIPFSVGAVSSGCITDVEMSLRGLFVIGADTEGVGAAVTGGPPAALPKKEEMLVLFG